MTRAVSPRLAPQNKGRFTRFPVNFNFAPEQAPGRLEVTIEVDSLDTATRSAMRRCAAPTSSPWPSIRRHSSSPPSSPGDPTGFQASGKLTLRGVTHDAVVPFTFRTATEAGVAVGYMAGKTSIKRLDYGVGQGEWKATTRSATRSASSSHSD